MLGLLPPKTGAHAEDYNLTSRRMEASEIACPQNAQVRGEKYYSVFSVGKFASVQARQPPSMEMQFV
jgi:hypothetical protein